MTAQSAPSTTLSAHASRPIAEQPLPKIEKFTFTGSGSEYFRIWIVNLLLTIVTLGIYSAWAKVRKMRYFYGSTRLAGSSFEYHGDPIAILKGRLIAAALFIVYTIVSGYSLTAQMVMLVPLPWLFPGCSGKACSSSSTTPAIVAYASVFAAVPGKPTGITWPCPF
jgi:hypothetical protein